MPNRSVKCPQCGHEFDAETKWGAKDWVLYAIAVGPVGLMALVIAIMGIRALLGFVGF